MDLLYAMIMIYVLSTMFVQVNPSSLLCLDLNSTRYPPHSLIPSIFLSFYLLSSIFYLSILKPNLLIHCQGGICTGAIVECGSDEVCRDGDCGKRALPSI